MSLYSDLVEVLTPYANKIKELATSDDQIKADLDNLTTVNEGINFTISIDSNGNATLTRSDLIVTEEEDY